MSDDRKETPPKGAPAAKAPRATLRAAAAPVGRGEPFGGPLPEERPPRVQPRIIAAPKLRQLYWCDFWRDAHLPEMWKTRPVVVVSYKNNLHGPCLVVPTSTDPQDASPWAHELSTSIDGRRSWAICNQPSTVAPSRLSVHRSRIPLVSKEDLNEILARLHSWLPRPFDPDE